MYLLTFIVGACIGALLQLLWEMYLGNRSDAQAIRRYERARLRAERWAEEQRR